MQLQVHVNEIGECELESCDVTSEEDPWILHKAAGIICRYFSGITLQSDHYDPSGKLERNKCKEFVPNCL